MIREAAPARGVVLRRNGEDEHWACGSHAVSRWLLTGTSTTGERLRVRGCDLFDLAPDGRIGRKDSHGKLVG